MKFNYDTPARFTAAVVTIKMADGPRALYYNADTHECQAEFPYRRRRPGWVKVGVYDAKELNGPRGINNKLTRKIREDLNEVIRRVARVAE